MGDEFNINLNNSVKFLKKNWNWIILLVIIIIAWNYRAYHLDYPVIGYHNWKETHYLTEARNFARDGFFANGFFMPVWDYPGINTDPSGVHSDTFPTTSILVGLGFKIFGYNLAVARTINILMVLISIVLFYLIIKKLFDNEILALTATALMAMNPLLIFFGRQVQLINTSLMFGMIGIYFYLKWLDDFSWSNTIMFSLAIIISVLTKYTFALLVIPMIAIFPFKKLKEKKYWKKFIVIIVIALIGSLWIPYSVVDSSNNIQSQVTAVSISKIFEKSFWSVMKSYAADNYTLLGVLLAGLGLALFLLNFNKNRSKAGYKFFLAYFIGSVFWFVVLSYKLSGHNYHQYPLVALMVFLMAYLFMIVASTIGTFLASLIKLSKLKNIIKKTAITIVILILLLVIHNPSMESKNRMFDTQFFGMDIAGSYINTHKLSGERVIHSSHQAYGLLWHGDIKGTAGIPNLEGIKYAEENLNATWLFIYNWDFAKIATDRERWNYIANNYELVQTAFSVNQNQLTGLYYFLFKKGGSFNETLFYEDGNLNVELFSNMLQGKPIQNWEYERSIDNPIIQYVNFK
ncbi:MAG: glycosyltransferase family 39 protein [archaeon]